MGPTHAARETKPKPTDIIAALADGPAFRLPVQALNAGRLPAVDRLRGLSAGCPRFPLRRRN